MTCHSQQVRPAMLGGDGTGPDKAAGPCRGRFRWWLAVLVFLSMWVGVRAEDASSVFDAANRLYEQGKFKEAAAAYQKVLESGRGSAALLFNLGNACFKAGQIGRAIVAYSRAEELNPRDPDLRANLRFARNQVQGPTVLPSLWDRLWRALSLNEWTLLVAGAFWLWLLLLAVLQFRPALRPAFRSYVVGLGLAVLVLFVGFASAFYNLRLDRRAIVVTSEAPIRQGPLDESQSTFTVHDGAELQVLDQKDEWLQVSTDPRRIGWIRRDQVRVLPPG